MDYEKFKRMFNYSGEAQKSEQTSVLAEDIVLKKVYECTLEITINYPRSKRFMSLSVQEQVQVYRDLWEKLLEKISFCGKKDNRYVIEFCKDGTPHLHGSITCYDMANHYEMGVVSEVAKMIYLLLPKQYYKQYARGEYNHKFLRYKCHAVCINYKNVLTEGWDLYMEKTRV